MTEKLRVLAGGEYAIRPADSSCFTWNFCISSALHRIFKSSRIAGRIVEDVFPVPEVPSISVCRKRSFAYIVMFFPVFMSRTIFMLYEISFFFWDSGSMECVILYASTFLRHAGSRSAKKTPFDKRRPIGIRGSCVTIRPSSNTIFFVKASSTGRRRIAGRKIRDNPQ